MGRWGSTLSSLHRPVSDHLASPSRKFLNVLLESLTSPCQHATALIAEDSFSQGKENDLLLKSPAAMEFSGFLTSQRPETITFGIFGTLGHGAICSGSAREWSFSRHGVNFGRRFSSTSIQEVEVKCWSCEETSSENPFFVCAGQFNLWTKSWTIFSFFPCKFCLLLLRSSTFFLKSLLELFLI
jgi:hypothetical protein